MGGSDKGCMTTVEDCMNHLKPILAIVLLGSVALPTAAMADDRAEPRSAVFLADCRSQLG